MLDDVVCSDDCKKECDDNVHQGQHILLVPTIMRIWRRFFSYNAPI